MITVIVCKFKTKKGDTILCARMYINGILRATFTNEEFIEYVFGVSRETMDVDKLVIIYE